MVEIGKIYENRGSPSLTLNIIVTLGSSPSLTLNNVVRLDKNSLKQWTYPAYNTINKVQMDEVTLISLSSSMEFSICTYLHRPPGIPGGVPHNVISSLSVLSSTSLATL